MKTMEMEMVTLRCLHGMRYLPALIHWRSLQLYLVLKVRRQEGHVWLRGSESSYYWRIGPTALLPSRTKAGNEYRKERESKRK